MLKNYFKVAWRNLFRNKGFSLTNLLGLTIGITCIILICLWVQDELTYNKFHKKYDNIYQVMANRNFNNQIFTDPNMVLPLAKNLEQGYPQIKHAVVTSYSEPHVLAVKDLKLKKQGLTVSNAFFEVFTWRFIEGSPESAIIDPSSIVLTKSAAIALFGQEEPLNKTIRIEDQENVQVTAIIEDIPGNSTLQFDYIRPFKTNEPYYRDAMNNWNSSSWTVFLDLVPGANISQVNRVINEVERAHNNGDRVSEYFVFPMSKWRLYSDFKDGKNIGGMISYVRLFSIIAVIILLIACVNFMNLSTARSEKRAKEVGIRKTLGSGRKQLVLQFFFESMILAVASFILSVIAVYLLLPSFNQLVNKTLSLDIAQPLFWAGMLGVVLFTGVCAGSYPALYLSSFNPTKVLKGTFLAGRAAILPRRILVVGQFVISILLISATVVVYRQIQHVKSRDMGYNANNLVMIPAGEAINKSFAVLKNELLKTGDISSVTRSFSPITEVWWKTPAPDWPGKPANANLIVSAMSADVDFTKTMAIKMAEGSDFTGMPSDSSAMILNKAAVAAMQLKNPVGTQLTYRKTYTVIGVTENVVQESPFRPVEPMMIMYNGDNGNYVNVRLKNGVKPQDALQKMEVLFKKFNPAFPFEYQFVDKEFNRKFLTEELISKLTTIFAGLAIFICCIGLAGLASFTIEKRIREIGIRKVLGASVESLLMLVSKEFLKLVLLAFVIAVPIAWWFMNNWLQNYDYRVTISFWIFGIVGGIIMMLTLVVVILNTLKAALNNPVKSLRTE
jgi:ABC-type antimicrobial peptide transport system permease subunit